MTPRADPTFATRRTPERYSDGPVFAEMIRRRTGTTLAGWQRAGLDVALERIDGPGSPFAYDKVVDIVGRRCGKTTKLLLVALGRALAGPVVLPNGRRVSFTGGHQAQNLTLARKRFLSDLVAPTQQRTDPRTWARTARVYLTTGATRLLIDPFGRSWRSADVSEIQVYAATTHGVRGEGQLHTGLDEAMLLSRAEGLAVESATRPTMAEFGGHAQQWITSNVTTDCDDSRWLTALRDAGRAAVDSDRREGVCYTEFSAPPDADVSDERLWWRHLPALGDGMIGIEQLRRDFEDLGAAAFGAEYLGLWPGGSGAGSWQSIPAAAWEAALWTDDAPDGSAPVLGVGLDSDPFGRTTSVAVATRPDPSGPLLVEIVAHGEGTSWGTARAANVAGKATVAVDDYGPGRLALADLGASGLAVPTRDAAAACWRWEQAVTAGEVRYWPNGDLSEAVRTARRTAGRGWLYERRVGTPQTPLWAAVLAVWAAERAAVPIPAAIY